MVNILLIRHGQNDWVTQKRLAGWIAGVHLNETGEAQARQAAERIAQLPVSAVYSSPVTRCVETAHIIAQRLDLDVTRVEAVGEVRYGEWEGEEIEALSRKDAWHAVQHYPSRFRFPGGEALRDVQARAVTALEALGKKHDKEVVVVVSHADVIKLVLAYYLGVHIDLFQRIAISPGSVSALALSEKGGVHVLRINDDGPLQPPPKPEKTDETATETDETSKEGA